MGGGSSGRTGARAHAIISARFIWRKRKIRYSGGCWETEREIKVDCCFLFFVLQIFVLRGTMNSSAGAGNYRKASSKGDKVIYMWSLLCCSLFSPGTITHKKKNNNKKKKKKRKKKEKAKENPPSSVWRSVAGVLLQAHSGARRRFYFVPLLIGTEDGQSRVACCWCAGVLLPFWVRKSRFLNLHLSQMSLRLHVRRFSRVNVETASATVPSVGGLSKSSLDSFDNFFADFTAQIGYPSAARAVKPIRLSW